MHVVLIGIQGSGKGTLAKSLCSQYGFAHLSTGDMFRDEYARKTPLGIEAQFYWGSGGLAPDALTIQMLKPYLSKNAKFVLDGFPRTQVQAQMLSEITHIDFAIELQLSKQEAIHRLSNREQCEKCGIIYGVNIPPKQKGICDKCNNVLTKREDDNEDAIRKRFAQYHEKTAPILDFYKAQGILITLDGGQKPDNVLADTVRALKINS